MIEYYTFMHKGGADEYLDNIYMNYGPTLVALIHYGSKPDSVDVDQFIKCGAAILNSQNKNWEEMSENIASLSPENNDYLLLKISDTKVRIERHGDIIPYIVKTGELKALPNGVYHLEDEDRIVCATSRFYKTLSDVAILADAMTSINCEEWMDFMVNRISERNMLSCGNLTAINFIVRSDEDYIP